MSTKQKQKQEILTITILQDFLLMLLFKELKDLLRFIRFVLAYDNKDNGDNKLERKSHTKYFFQE